MSDMPDLLIALVIIAVASVTLLVTRSLMDEISGAWNRRFFGAMGLGLVPCVVSIALFDGWAQRTGLWGPLTVSGMFWTIVFAAICVGLMSKVASSDAMTRLHPEQPYWPDRPQQWWRNNVGVWLAYLLAYEFLFRGFVLLGLAPLIGVFPAFVVSTALYVLGKKGAKVGEKVGALVFAFPLAWLSLEGGFLLPLVVHLSIVLSVDYFSLRAKSR